MPTYQYACTECGHAFEQFQSFSDDALTVCPACEGRLRKVFNAVGVVFKGSGFYRTDSRAGAGTDGAEPKKVETPNGAPSTSGDSAGTSSTSATSSNGSGEKAGTSTPAKTAGAKDPSAA